MKKMIAYCGLDCEACDAYNATINDDSELRVKTAKLWSDMNNVEITPEMINCAGCRADGIKTPYCESLCKIRRCGMSRGFETCGECPELEGCEKVGAVIKNMPEALRNLKDGSSAK